MIQLSEEQHARLVAAVDACGELALILPSLYPVKPRGMQAAGNERYEVVLSVNRLERARRLVAKALQCDVADLRPKEGVTA